MEWAGIIALFAFLQQRCKMLKKRKFAKMCHYFIKPIKGIIFSRIPLLLILYIILNSHLSLNSDYLQVYVDFSEITLFLE